MIKVAINGFGRIGRRVFRLALQHPQIEIVAINDLADSKTLSHVLKYDSIHGVSKSEISSDISNIIVNDSKVPLSHHNHPRDINWQSYNIDFVIECTGKFKTRELLHYHIKNGAKRVILSAPPVEEDIKTIVLGINDKHLLELIEEIFKAQGSFLL